MRRVLVGHREKAHRRMFCREPRAQRADAARADDGDAEILCRHALLLPWRSASCSLSDREAGDHHECTRSRIRRDLGFREDRGDGFCRRRQDFVGLEAQAKSLADQCVKDAQGNGIPKSEIDQAFDDLAAFIGGQIDEARDRGADRSGEAHPGNLVETDDTRVIDEQEDEAEEDAKGT